MDLSDSRHASLQSEHELWEYLIAHDEVEDFYVWVEKYRLENDARTE